ncbi:hypothetical protein BDW62DRAFT_206375 [Aspergillus aurantiobrunneus]
MDPKQSQPQPAPSQYLRPPPHHRPTAPSSSTQSSSAPRAPPAQISAHPSVTISDNANFVGPYSISIGKGTIIHPRTRICATEGPVKIGEGCIISEKTIIGTLPGTPNNSGSESRSNDEAEEKAIVISSNVTVGIQVVIHPGARLHSGVVVDNQAVVGRGADIGAHSKICARCELADGARVKEWVVVWGAGKGTGVRRRVKVQKKVVSPLVGDGRGQEGVMEGRTVEDARLVAMKREREALARFIVGVKRK